MKVSFLQTAGISPNILGLYCINELSAGRAVASFGFMESNNAVSAF